MYTVWAYTVLPQVVLQPVVVHLYTVWYIAKQGQLGNMLVKAFMLRTPTGQVNEHSVISGLCYGNNSFEAFGYILGEHISY